MGRRAVATAVLLVTHILVGRAVTILPQAWAGVAGRLAGSERPMGEPGEGEAVLVEDVPRQLPPGEEGLQTVVAGVTRLLTDTLERLLAGPGEEVAEEERSGQDVNIKFSFDDIAAASRGPLASTPSTGGRDTERRVLPSPRGRPRLEAAQLPPAPGGGPPGGGRILASHQLHTEASVIYSRASAIYKEMEHINN